MCLFRGGMTLNSEVRDRCVLEGHKVRKVFANMYLAYDDTHLLLG
jgi:hypothetical protein